MNITTRLLARKLTALTVLLAVGVSATVSAQTFLDGANQLPAQQAPTSVETIINRATQNKQPVPVTGQPATTLPSAAAGAQAPTRIDRNSHLARLLRSVGATPTASLIAGNDPVQVKSAAARLENSYGLSPALLNLENRAPRNSQSVVRQLNLHQPRGGRTSFINRTPSVEELVRALRVR